MSVHVKIVPFHSLGVSTGGQINMKNQDIDFSPDDICRPYYGSVPRWYSEKNDYTDWKEGRA